MTEKRHHLTHHLEIIYREGVGCVFVCVRKGEEELC